MTTATLIELQTERARLKAVEAERELSEALAETRKAEDLLGAALAVRSLLLEELRTLPHRLAQAIEELGINLGDYIDELFDDNVPVGRYMESVQPDEDV